MAKTIRVDEEAYERFEENARPFEPVWKAVRRTLQLEVPPESTSLAEFEEELKEKEPHHGP